MMVLLFLSISVHALRISDSNSKVCLKDSILYPFLIFNLHIKHAFTEVLFYGETNKTFKNTSKVFQSVTKQPQAE